MAWVAVDRAVADPLPVAVVVADAAALAAAVADLAAAWEA
jgi:hypothetical protein